MVIKAFKTARSKRMNKYIIHYHNIEYNRPFCNQTTIKNYFYMTNKKSNVTCKKCLKKLDRIK
jgi:hypothetical protein